MGSRMAGRGATPAARTLRASPRFANRRSRTASRRGRARPAPRSARTRRVPFHRKAWAEPPRQGSDLSDMHRIDLSRSGLSRHPARCRPRYDNEARPKYFKSGMELIFRKSWNFFARRSQCTKSAVDRHRRDDVSTWNGASSTWFVHVACHKKFLCGREIRLRVPGVVTLCEASREGRQHSRAEIRHAWAIFAITPPVPSPSSFAMSGCGRFRTRSSSPPCWAR